MGICEFENGDSEGLIRLDLCPDYRENSEDEFFIVLDEVRNGTIDEDRKILKVVVENDIGKLQCKVSQIGQVNN